MPRTCGVCRHEKRVAIERAILDGQSDEKIARQFGQLSRAGVQRHGTRHLPKARRAAAESSRRAEARTLLERVTKHVDRLERDVDEADSSGGAARATFLATARELTAALGLLGKATGEIQTGTQVQLNVLAGVWQRLGVKDEDELRTLVESGREREAMRANLSHEQMFESGLEVLSMVVIKHPEWGPQVAERLSWLAPHFKAAMIFYSDD